MGRRKVSGAEDRVPDRKHKCEVFVKVTLSDRVMDAMKTRFGNHLTKSPIGDLGIGMDHLSHKGQDDYTSKRHDGVHVHQEADGCQNHEHAQDVFEPTMVIVN